MIDLLFAAAILAVVIAHIAALYLEKRRLRK